MKKIPTLFERDLAARNRPVTPTVKPECAWVLDGEGIATEKVDGTNVKVFDGRLFKRQKPITGIYDEAAYVPCAREDPADRWAWEAYDRASSMIAECPTPFPPRDGIYELLGPKVQGNPHRLTEHILMAVDPIAPTLVLSEKPPRDFNGLRAYLVAKHIEGIVFRHADGRMAKIKRRDFGIPWPAIKA